MHRPAPSPWGSTAHWGRLNMKPYIDNLSKCADCYVFAYPNAGLPNAMGGYDQKVRVALTVCFAKTPVVLDEFLVKPASRAYAFSARAQGIHTQPRDASHGDRGRK